MPRKSLVDVARRIREALGAGTIIPGQLYSLEHFARLAGARQETVRKVLDIWQTLAGAGYEVSFEKFHAGAGAPARYAVKVAARQGHPPVASPGGDPSQAGDSTGRLQTPPEKIDWSKIKPAGKRPRAPF